ncbi:hypothetical protein AM587_10002928 [Phytophthora nicotianae]|uniref:RxLR effector protein n=1 Tax=Phytophthora nicotianae TaxID=4792 RepID=A0A0W8CTG5_PHYNI|nr:hypothetical protein AM587_10002928 [Phytophthora nicotianae]KUF87451.1 Echinoderm microtubule-associated protein [Phytophthora nicotianae]
MRGVFNVVIALAVLASSSVIANQPGVLTKADPDLVVRDGTSHTRLLRVNDEGDDDLKLSEANEERAKISGQREIAKMFNLKQKEFDAIVAKAKRHNLSAAKKLQKNPLQGPDDLKSLEVQKFMRIYAKIKNPEKAKNLGYFKNSEQFARYNAFIKQPVSTV